jgi:hypothetical protein
MLYLFIEIVTRRSNLHSKRSHRSRDNKNANKCAKEKEECGEFKVCCANSNLICDRDLNSGLGGKCSKKKYVALTAK